LYRTLRAVSSSAVVDVRVVFLKHFRVNPSNFLSFSRAVDAFSRWLQVLNSDGNEIGLAVN